MIYLRLKPVIFLGLCIFIAVSILTGCDRGMVRIEENVCVPIRMDPDIQFSQTGDGINVTCVIRVPVLDKDGNPVKKVSLL